MTQLIKMKTSYIQRKFPKNTAKQIYSYFDIPIDEELLCGIWNSSIFRHGFVITNQSLYWYFKTKNGMKTGKIQKESASNIQFEISPYISSENSVASQANSIAEECSKLEIRSDEGTEEFYITGLTEEKSRTLCDILKFGFTQNELPQIDLAGLVKEMPLVPLRNFTDKILNLGDAAAEKISTFKDYLAKGIYEITHIKFVVKQNEEDSEDSKQESENKQDFAEKLDSLTGSMTDRKVAETENKQTSSKARGLAFSLLMNFIDICASLFFIAGIVVILRPELLKSSCLQSDQFKVIAIAIYILSKITVAFYSKKVYKKILPVILIVVSILSYFLFSYSFNLSQNSNQPNVFLPFIVTSCILELLSYFAFEYSCGYRSRTLFKKIIVIIILSFAIYVAAKFAIYEQKNEFLIAARIFWIELYDFCRTLK